MDLRKKIRFHWAYYLSTLRLSVIAMFIVGTICVIRGTGVKDCLPALLFLYPILGLGLDFLYKRMLRRNEFHFYHNASCSTLELLSVSFVLSTIVSTILYQIYKLWI